MICSIAFSKASAFNTLSDCLIANDIGIYSFDTESANMGKGSGVVGLAGHFNRDHEDTVCTGEYSNITEIQGLPIEEARQKIIGIDVQVTQHSGSDSDRWLLHEVERDFRNYYGLPDDSFVARQINGNTIIGLSVAGWTYRWVSGNKVIQIQYHDSQMTKPEPLEVVRAYLAKHPSTLTAMTSADLRTEENKTKWIKDEMERRLWLCDRWFYQLQLKKVELRKTLREAVDHMKVFLDYREKYYGISAKSEKQVLWKYMIENNGTAIKNKLKEYKEWWSLNKGKAINL
ncbi:MAG TPA: hypothetical protein ENH28_07260 [Euryarchaeota archaeon]|nr:hypothetical protein [Euryarchaeota archaeon]